MRTADAYGDLLELGRPVIETREAALRLATSQTNTSRILRAASDAGLIRQIRQGLWALDLAADPVTVAPYLTAPLPAYVSGWSALAHHDMIEQIPATTFVVSLDRTKTVETALGTFEIHHLAPELFSGFTGDPNSGYLATAEKALFDSVYLRAPRGGRVYFPELTLPDHFDAAKLAAWADQVSRPRLRTLVTRGIREALERAAG